MSKVYTDQIEKRTGGTAMDVPASGKWDTANIADDAIDTTQIASGAVGATELDATLDLSTKTVTLPAASVTDHVVPYDDNTLKEEIALLGFRTAANGSLAKYNLVDQTIDAFEDATGIDASASTGEHRNASNYYSGGASGTVTGGTITTHGVYTVHSFLSGTTNFVTDIAGTADVLLVAGGGSGGGSHANQGSGGGGGGGGVRALASQSVSAATHAVTVGAGATGSQYGNNGVDSSIVLGSTLTASGGGGGGFGTSDTSDTRDGLAGASGGGGGIGQTAKSGGAGNTPSTSPVQGYAGGNAATGGAGGGGGAGAVGVTSTGAGSNGGAGIQNDYRTGSNVYYGGGGGGSRHTTGANGSGGQGGGGNSGQAGGNIGSAGTVNTGGGGGGSHGGNGSHWVGGSGGSGIVVVRYNTNSGFVTYNDMTLISNATTAQAAPTKGDLVMTYSNGAGTATVNTDLKAYASRDDGTTWTQLTLASQGSTGAHTILSAHDLDISGQPSGTAMRYKITTHNQSVTKSTRVHAVSLGWS